VSVTAPFWIINKTGLPLVIGKLRSSECRFEELEIPCMVVPLLFSYYFHGGLVRARVGNGLHTDGTPKVSFN
jgi:hypothetical protein